MVEAIVTFSLIGLGVFAWAAAYLARNFYRQRGVHRTSPHEASFLATLFSDAAPSGEASHLQPSRGTSTDTAQPPVARGGADPITHE